MISGYRLNFLARRFRANRRLLFTRLFWTNFRLRLRVKCRLRFRSRHRFRFANLRLRCRVKRRLRSAIDLRLLTWRRLRRGVAVVSLKTAPVGVEIRTKRSGGQQNGRQGDAIENWMFHRRNYFSFGVAVAELVFPPSSSGRISISVAPVGRWNMKSESAMRSVTFHRVISAVNSGTPGSFL